MSTQQESSAEAVTIASRIDLHRSALTPSHRQIADYVLAHPLQAATMPIDELAAAVGVSVATANRFARAIGLDGYPMLRAELVKGFEAMLAPLEKMRIRLEKPCSVHDAFVAAMEESLRNVAATREALTPQACEEAVQLILGARRVYVLGYGSSGWLAGLLQRGLDLDCDNVHLLTSVAGTSHSARLLPRMTAQDLLIAISFPRYLADTVSVAQSAAQQGVRVLALTDSTQSPLGKVAHCHLFAQTDNYYAATSEASILALIEALSSAVSLQANHPLQNAARMTESVRPWLYGGSPRGQGIHTTPAADMSPEHNHGDLQAP